MRFLSRSSLTKTCVAGALMACLSLPAHAYYGGTFSWSDPAGGYAEWSRARLYQDTIDYNRKIAQGRSSSRSSSGSKNKGSGNAAKPAPAGDPKVYLYTPSPAVSEQVKKEFLDAFLQHAKANGVDAKGEKQIRDMHDWGAIELMRERIRKGGENPDSLATVMGLWLLINYSTIAAADGSEVPTTALVQQLQRTMSEDASTKAMSNEEKQRAAEVMLWLAFVQIVANAELGESEQAKAEAAKLARESLMSQGIDPDRMKITANGLEIE